VDSLETLVQSRTPAPAATVEAEPTSPIVPARTRRLRPRAPSGADEGLRPGLLLHDGRYLLCERLGAGGFGVVWRARDELLHREVALKRVPLAGPTLDAADRSSPSGGCEEGADAIERVSREALAAARLGHPAIVALYEAFFAGDAFCLVSELIDGETLATLIAEDRLTDEQVFEIGVVLAEALEHAHARGVVHRDVKPQNVLVPDEPSAHGTVAKLTDFGGAWLIGEDGLTRPGETLGTLAYMAPEQSEGHEASAATDLYSLALSLREGLTGVNPVRGPTPAATARRIGSRLPTIARDRPDLPPRLVRGLDTATDPDPRRRGTVQALHEALESEPAPPGAAPGRRRPRRALAGQPASDPVFSRAAEHSHRTTPFRARRRPSDREHDPALGSSDPAIPAREPALPEHDPVPQRARRRLPVPRVAWAGSALAAAVWLASTSKPGAGLLLLAAVVPALLLLGPRPGFAWLSAGLAPVFGLVGLAGVYPALAGQAGGWQRRALLGAFGYWWLTLATALVAGGSSGARLWLAPPAGLPQRSAWEGSLDSAATHVIAPALAFGTLFGAILWALAAAVLPWVVRGRSPLIDAIAAACWSAGLLAATPYFDAGLTSGSALSQPRGAVLAAVLAAATAVGARALRGPIGRPPVEVPHRQP
jgi:eukaryotic-like serine/threonine-protein kinase